MLKNQYNKRLNNVNIMSLAVLTVLIQKNRFWIERKERKKHHIEFIGQDTDRYKRMQENVDNGWNKQIYTYKRERKKRAETLTIWSYLIGIPT